jgi:hypothetical protein
MATYLRNGNTITDGDSTYLISQRKRLTPSKPRYFLLRIEAKKRLYISSLYGQYPNYQFEYSGQRYTLTLTDISATITKASEVAGRANVHV